MSIWKQFCRAIESKQTIKHLGNLVPEIDRHSIFEFTEEQSIKSQEYDITKLSEEYPVPPFPFPKVCIVHHDGVIALREPYFDEETGLFEYDVVTWTKNDDHEGAWCLSTGSVQVDTTKKDDDGRFKWDVFDMAGILMSNSVSYPFDEDNPIALHEEGREDLSDLHTQMKLVRSKLQNDLKEAKASRNLRQIRAAEAQLEEYKTLKESIQEHEDHEDSVAAKLEVHAQNINEMTMTNLRGHFYLGLQNVAWVNHPDHYVVEINPESRPKKRKKKRLSRWNEREHHILLTREEITEEWHRTHRGGTHASPMPHLRRGHYKTLRADRYKEARGKKVWVRATHVNGECVEWRDGDISYKVI